LNAAAQAHIQASTRQITLQSISANLLAWKNFAASLPQDQPLEPTERWRVLAIITPAADFSPAWMALLETQPPASALPASYTTWIDQALAQINAEINALDQQIDFLEQQRTDLANRYTAASTESLGLSPNLEIQDVQVLPTKVIHPTGTLIIVGGLIGLLAWIFFQLTRGSLPNRISPPAVQETEP
jgi:hypothetical protein